MLLSRLVFKGRLHHVSISGFNFPDQTTVAEFETYIAAQIQQFTAEKDGRYYWSGYN